MFVSACLVAGIQSPLTVTAHVNGVWESISFPPPLLPYLQVRATEAGL